MNTVHSQTKSIPDSLQESKIESRTNLDSLIHLKPLMSGKIINPSLKIPKYPFKIGEKLVFEIKYGFIKAGWATMEVKDTLYLRGEKVILIQTTAKSTKGFDPFFKVRDTVRTFVNFYKFQPVQFIKKLREGGYLYDLYVDYDRNNRIARVKTIRYRKNLRTIRKKDSLEIPIPDEVYDVLASFYKIRTYTLAPDTVVYITNHDNKKIYDLKIEVLKREVVKTPAGKFRCLKIEPKLRGEAIFKQKGRLWIWVTDDEYKIPVKMSSKVVVGSIKTILKRIINGPAVIPSRID
jgi:hypothetical protein